MLNGRLYRAAFIPFLFALAIAAFSLSPGPAPDGSTLAPDAFEGAPAFAELQSLARRYPQRRPGGFGDQQLAGYVAQTLEGLGGTAGGGFSVRTYRHSAQTIDGERALTTVVAQRPGSTGAPPILILAHRDAATPGAAAELSGTAALLELARVFSARETRHTIVLVSTSGGSGGDAGAALLASDPAALGLHGPFDAAIVLGDLAGTRLGAPVVVPFSDGLGSAPLELQSTVAEAIGQETGIQAGAPSVLGQLAHLAFPVALGEQGVLNAAGIPAVLVQVSGERGPGPGPAAEALSGERLEGLGRAVLSAVDALDTAPNVPQSAQTGLQLQHKTLPMWALRLLVGTLLLPVLATALDGLARARRRRLAVGRTTLWTLSCALPFLICVVFVYVLGWLGVLGATPATPAPAGALPLDARALSALAAVALTFALAWLLRAALLRRLGWGAPANPELGGLTLVLVLAPVALVAWFINPLAALLALPALHAWLVLAAPGRMAIAERVPRALAVALVLVGVLPVALLIGFYAAQLGLGAGEVAWTGLLLLAGGYVGFGAALLWSVAFGCAGAAAILGVAGMGVHTAPLPAAQREVTIRGPRSYAGPGSLGGTESALRR
ncbi:MAG TPA: M28 family peptidase [Solirubrobacteraceae bacterium]|nr:M28 family peptidase [Solirubrobacteraceae bacterium]